MTSGIDWRIPPSILRHLAEMPRDRPIVLLLRHSVRYDLPPDAPGNDVPLTEVGRALAGDLGERIGVRLKSLHSSPYSPLHTDRECDPRRRGPEDDGHPGPLAG
jgi:hypothetical protein